MNYILAERNTKSVLHVTRNEDDDWASRFTRYMPLTRKLRVQCSANQEVRRVLLSVYASGTRILLPGALKVFLLLVEYYKRL